ncbi:MAG TPA: hypothetical protein VKP04_09510, partial [Ktedonobacteraceae bacterium]|nr:hypothetical protein [Ktedonobacteraceae bacterium]
SAPTGVGVFCESAKSAVGGMGCLGYFVKVLSRLIRMLRWLDCNPVDFSGRYFVYVYVTG